MNNIIIIRWWSRNARSTPCCSWNKAWRLLMWILKRVREVFWVISSMEIASERNQRKWMLCMAHVLRDNFILSLFENYHQNRQCAQVVSDFFEKNNLCWANFVGVCSEQMEAPAVISSRSWFVALVKQIIPRTRGTHCLQYISDR